MRLTKNQRAQLQAVLDLVAASPDINLGMAANVLNAQMIRNDAAASRSEQIDYVAGNPEDDEEIQKEQVNAAKAWSASDECESQRDGSLDDARDHIYFEFDATREMGEAFFRRDWFKPAKGV